MYIAGLPPISPSQVLEALIVFTAFDFFKFLSSCLRAVAIQAESKGGHIRAETMPILGRIVTYVQALAIHVPPAVYIVAVVFHRLRQPTWMEQFALSDEVTGPVSKSALRVGACVAGLGLRKIVEVVFYHLGDQWHSLGRRERPRVVQTGPYAWVRHPMYSAALLQEVVWSVMFWSYIPLVALGITATAFAIKMPIEEAIIQQDGGIKEEYRDYKRKVRARIIPCVW